MCEVDPPADSDPVRLFGSRAIVNVGSRILCQSRLASGLHRSFALRDFKTEASYSLSAISVLSSDPNLLDWLMLSYIFIYEIFSRVFVVATAKKPTTKLSNESNDYFRKLHCVQTTNYYQIYHTFESQMYGFLSSRVAQWKRAGPITQRSVDRNHALLWSNFFYTFFDVKICIAIEKCYVDLALEILHT